MSKYRDWELLEKLPEGWKIDKTAGSPVHGYDFCTNGKSVFNGQKRALVKVIDKENIVIESECKNIEVQNNESKKSKEKIIDVHCVRAVNELARKKFEERILNDILVDLMICEIEGWGKEKYINELKKLIVGLLNNKTIIAKCINDEVLQIPLFT